jgi:hypothetical protein
MGFIKPAPEGFVLRPQTLVEPPQPGRLRRLTEELAEEGFDFDGSEPWHGLLLVELDYALRPRLHERRVPSVGAIIAPTTDPDVWERAAELSLTHGPIGEMPAAAVRLFADGLSSWLVRRHDGPDEFVVFDRPAGSERDLVVLAEAMGATIVQRHPSGGVRVVGEFGVLRWDGISWHHEPPTQGWIDEMSACSEHGDREVLNDLLEFAVHDLGARRIGATLVYRPDTGPTTAFEARLPVPPPLRIGRPADLAPLRHVLSQIDGAAIFDARGTLQHLGVRLVPSRQAESDVEGYRGMRHTSGRRYSFDDPLATVIVVSEDGPVTVLRGGELQGSSLTS